MSVEESKWLIQRIDHTLESLQKELQTVLTRYDEIGNNEIKRLRGRRNNILSALGIGLTILLGIYSVDEIDQNLFFVILIPMLILGLVIFVVFNIYVIRTEVQFTLLHNAVLESETQISMCLGVFISTTANLQSLDYQKLWNWFLMNRSLAGAMYVPPMKVILLQDSKIFNPDLDKSMKEEATALMTILTNFEKSTRDFDREVDYLPTFTIQFIDDSLKTYNELKKLK